MSTLYTVSLSQQQKDWQYVWDPTISPVQATCGFILSTPQGLMLQTAHSLPSKGAWLAKNVAALPIQLPTVSFVYDLMFDGAIASADAQENDMKLTDADGWTYDGSMRTLVRSLNWPVEIWGPWTSSGGNVPPMAPGQFVNVAQNYYIDYVAHKITFLSIVTTTPLQQYVLSINKTFAAKQVGWAKSEIVTQLQPQTVGSGAYTVTYNNLKYTLQ